MISGIVRDSGAALRRLGAIGFAVAVATLLSIASPAKAATINTYSFTQGGYSVGPDIYGTVQGTFSGYVGSDGLMKLAGLTAFYLQANVHFVFTDYVVLNIDMPTEFSFDTMGGNSSLSLLVAMQDVGAGDDKVCIGSLTPFRCNVPGSYHGAYPNIPLATSAFPQLTLVSSVTVAPVPGSVLLFATALFGLGLLGVRVRRQQRAA